MDPYVRTHTHTLQTWSLSASWSVYVRVLTITASFPSRRVTTAQHCGGTEKRRLTPFRLYGVSMASVHRHRPIDPVGKKGIKVFTAMFYSLSFVSL